LFYLWRLKEEKMNIYVGNLPYQVNDNSLQAAFSVHGSVDSARVVTDRDSGRSKGFGFVEMTNADEAKKAIEALNGSSLEGRNITVNESRPKPAGGGDYRSSGGGNRGGGGRRDRY
jgi:RNA recognition motif-containing protein